MIIFEPTQHKYYHEYTREEYISVTTFLSKFYPFFDAEMQANLFALKNGLDPKVVLQAWKAKAKEATDKGTRIHKILENHLKIPGWLPKKKEERQVVKGFKELKLEGKMLSECLLWNDDYKIAGICDLAVINNGVCDIYDFKTNEKIEKVNKYKSKLLYPIDWMEDTKLNRYSLQLSLYAFMLEKMHNYTIGELNLLKIEINNKSAEFIKIPCTDYRYLIPELTDFR